jgi:hypothetical protein
VTHRRPPSTLVAAAALVAVSGAGALAPGDRQIADAQAARRAPAAHVPAAPPCVPSTLNRSALLAGTSLGVSPLPGSYDASPRTQISLLGAPPQALHGVIVSGSRTGAHPGRLRGYSQGEGASVIPSRPFTSGETVTVRGTVNVGARAQQFTFSFAVAESDPVTYAPATPKHRDPGALQHFHSAPSLQAPAIVVTARSTQTAPGDLFATPYSGPGASGPMIFDESGNLVWFDPLPRGIEATNLQVQQYEGRPVLTWWQGQIPLQGLGQGQEVIADGSYREIRRVSAGNGYQADLHDFHIMPTDTALLTVFHPIACNLSAVGGPSAGTVTDSLFQEIDLNTRLVRREWHSLDHVALGDSYSSPVGASTRWPFDFFHINSIDQQAAGTTLISARNTSALYELNTESGQVLTSIGGKHSGVKLAPGASTAYQHDATVQPNGTISVFDNGAVPKVHLQSRGIILSLDPQTNTGTLVAQYVHPIALVAGSQGNMQLLGNQDVFIGWGSAPYFSELSPQGQLLFDAHMRGSYQSYRAYRFPWSGAPPGTPAIAALPSAGGHSSAAGPLTVYASWNGDTRTASWRVLAGASPQRLAPVATAARTGFETAIATPGPQRYVAVAALDASGATLGVSPTIRG